MAHVNTDAQNLNQQYQYLTIECKNKYSLFLATTVNEDNETAILFQYHHLRVN